jgi:hypothetical protein
VRPSQDAVQDPDEAITAMQQDGIPRTITSPNHNASVRKQFVECLFGCATIPEALQFCMEGSEF